MGSDPAEIAAAREALTEWGAPRCAQPLPKPYLDLCGLRAGHDGHCRATGRPHPTQLHLRAHLRAVLAAYDALANPPAKVARWDGQTLVGPDLSYDHKHGWWNMHAGRLHTAYADENEARTACEKWARKHGWTVEGKK